MEIHATRRDLLRATGLGLTGTMLSACGGLGSDNSSDENTGTLKIGFVSPRTGAAAGFGEPDAYVLDLARKALAGGLTAGGTKYSVQILDRDSQSNPQRAAQVANDLINSDAVDLMLTTSTPETVNPVSDASEAAGVPCVSTVVPWEAWYFGRGAKPDEKNAYKFTYHFCFGVEQFHSMYAHEWPQVPTNRKVGVMWPNDSDGNAIRAALGPLLEQEGFTIVDPGAYTNGTNDFSAQIARFKAEGCEIFNSFPIPPDFATFWRQAAQQGFRPKICQVAKTGLFPSQIEALGDLGIGVAGGAYWTPTYPYASSLTKAGGKSLADGYRTATGKQWNQQLGPSLALFDVAAAALTATGNPKDRAAVARTIGTLDVETPVGRLRWGQGPNANVVATPILGGQWIKSTDSRDKVEFVLVENSSDPNVPTAAKLQQYGRR
ncbi:ABC transporter substrate-binding protein [Actinoplanes sp. LDG1-06]|uniref:ABC transporter substrate-binding protein n=1 Tax=Paractinoplanes ovalisporus TaxID=2810368 RepID=A0ABS2A868_9ACTN|nr:ABC transporter substrate-binding protein [Actinoplanes ovalisporus]MBM2616032.1 ABC transporter substrate-binding protein [Actinoplanes ovalisporus]